MADGGSLKRASKRRNDVGNEDSVTINNFEEYYPNNEVPVFTDDWTITVMYHLWMEPSMLLGSSEKDLHVYGNDAASTG